MTTMMITEACGGASGFPETFIPSERAGCPCEQLSSSQPPGSWTWSIALRPINIDQVHLFWRRGRHGCISSDPVKTSDIGYVRMAN